MSSLCVGNEQLYGDLHYWNTFFLGAVVDCTDVFYFANGNGFINNSASGSGEEPRKGSKVDENGSGEDRESIAAVLLGRSQSEKEEKGNGVATNSLELKIHSLHCYDTDTTACHRDFATTGKNKDIYTTQIYEEKDQFQTGFTAVDTEGRSEGPNFNCSYNDNSSCVAVVGPANVVDSTEEENYGNIVTSGRTKPFAFTFADTDVFSSVVVKKENRSFSVMGNSSSQPQGKKLSKKEKGPRSQSRKSFSSFRQQESTPSSSTKSRKSRQEDDRRHGLGSRNETEDGSLQSLKPALNVTKEEAPEQVGGSLKDQEQSDHQLRDDDDSALTTLRTVFCDISNLRDGPVSESEDATVQSPDRLQLSQPCSVLSTEAPASLVQSAGAGNPTEQCIPCTLLSSSPQAMLYNSGSTVSESIGETDLHNGTTNTVSALHDLLSSTDGFAGTLFYSWLLGHCSDAEATQFVERFSGSLLSARILIPKLSGEEVEKDAEIEKDSMAESEGITLFKKLKFVPSQIYTWGPFSRLASSNSTKKTSSYRDCAVRQFEISPTLASEAAKRSTVKQPEEERSNENRIDQMGVSSDLNTPTAPSSSNFNSPQRQEIQASNSAISATDRRQVAASDSGSATSPGCSNASKKLGNVWPPPRPEGEDETHKLKYTEAEHQHELMVLKRNHTDELYKITKDYETNIYEMNEEHTQDIESMQQEANLMRQEIAYLKAKLTADKHDASTQTQNVAHLRMTKGIQVNLSAELLTPPPQISLPTAADEAATPVAPAPPPPPPPAPPMAPPAPQAVGGPPPPPAPGFPTSRKDSPRKAPVEPRRPMKPLYWKRIQIARKDLPTNRSVWVEVEDLPINEEEMEQTFGKTTTTKKSKALSETIVDKKKVAPAKIFDAKRSQAVGIFLSSLHVEMTDLQEAIMNLDVSIVDEENMKSIYDLRASSQEMQAIQAHVSSQKKKKEEERQPLDKPEKFLYDLSEIEHFEDRLFCITFRSAFNDDIQDVKKELAHINSALQELQDKNTVLRLLGLILSVGNYLNGGNRSRGQADGFQLDILSKLKDVKGQKDNASFTLLNYIAWVYMRQYDQDVKYEIRPCPVPSFQSIILASQVNFSDVLKELKRIRKELKECEKRVTDVVKKTKRQAQPFKSIMEKFVETARTSLEQTDNELKSTQERFKNALEFFCVKPKSGSSKTVEPKDFFVLWQTFCMDFHAIWKIELKRLIKEEQLKAKQKVDEYRERQTATTVVATVRRRPNSLKTRLMQTRRRRGGDTAAT